MKEFWNERFGQEEYIYGTSPNIFFAEELKKLSPGKLLLPAEGEGRNAVHAALLGWNVTAFDYSEEGKQKAMKLAKDQSIKINYELKNASEFHANETYDAIALIYAHFAGEERKQLFVEIEKSLSQGGWLIMEVFSKTQLGNQSGGPKSLDLLYHKDEIRQLLPGLSFTLLEETKTELSEGPFHLGEAEVVRAVARKD